jgi:hypothetical protein
MNGEAKQEVVLARLEVLAAGGELTPDAVVADAKRKDSPLHGYFEWDDKQAGHKFRLMQARRLITRFQVSIIEETRILRAPFAVRDPSAEQGQQGYARTVDLQTDRARARLALTSEIGRLESYLSRVRALAVAFGMVEEVEEISTRVGALRDRLALAA